MSEATGADTAEATAERSDERPRTAWYRRRLVRGLSWFSTFGVAVYAAVRLFGIDSGWPLVTSIAFVPYAAAAAAVWAGVQAAVRHWRAVAATALLAVAMAAAVAPRAIADEQPSASGPELSVMSVNLYVGSGNLEYVVDLVEEHEPDLLSVQEMTPYAQDELARLGLEDLMPHSIITSGWAAEGTSLYSLHPLERLEEAEPDGIFYQVAAEVDLGGGETVRFLAVHAAAPYAPHRIPHWEQDFAEMPRPDDGAPWILAGDFNATLDHHLMRELIDDGYTDAADATGEGLAMTWRPLEGYLRGLVRPPAVALDHVLADERAAVLDFQVLPKDGSDHSPVLATIRLP
ncbi:endonuclease/exonuclease/phosphatase family protein [Glycomyces salinus]|uniref:endonuclease/exonuclease/phosphatase family protein n=1 Tax=Glycomyces salinus TaxID=980294 RepID=UPI0018ED81A9|nr:endonuclease/exonuclease/phosphatase family protein [Glycomyces salinus]